MTRTRRPARTRRYAYTLCALAAPRRRAGVRAACREAGVSTTIANTIILPVVILAAMAFVQVACVYLAHASALSAAQEGARIAALAEGDPMAAESAAHALLGRGIGVESGTVSVQRGVEVATATVRIVVATPIDIGEATIEVTQSRPVERLTS